MNICIFGGAFDPIHTGHKLMAEIAMKKYSFNKFIFLVSKTPPHKKDHSEAFNHRFNMVKLVADDLNKEFNEIEKYKNKCSFEVSDIENQMDGISYTYNSLIFLKKIYKNDKFIFLTGSDIFSSIESWYNYKELFNLTDFLIGYRPGVEFNDMLEKIPENIRCKIENKDGIKLLDLNSINISSSEIRHNLLSNNNHFDYIEESVKKYIKEHGLYV